MTAPSVGQSFVPCGRCRTLTGLEWVSFDDEGGGVEDFWLGLGNCAYCHSDVLSVCPGEGVGFERLAAFFSALETLLCRQGEGVGGRVSERLTDVVHFGANEPDNPLPLPVLLCNIWGV